MSSLFFPARPQPHPAAGPAVPSWLQDRVNVASDTPAAWPAGSPWAGQQHQAGIRVPSLQPWAAVSYSCSLNLWLYGLLLIEPPRAGSEWEERAGASFLSSSLSRLLAGCSCVAWCGAEHRLNYRSALLISASESQRSPELWSLQHSAGPGPRFPGWSLDPLLVDWVCLTWAPIGGLPWEMFLLGMGVGLELEGGKGRLGPLVGSLVYAEHRGTAYGGTGEMPLQFKKDEQVIK